MRELSVFVDESGDFGSYEPHAPYYLVTFIFHDQADDLSANIAKFDSALADVGIQNRAIHAGPLIRREEDYREESIETRRQIFNRLFNFTRKVPISYHTFFIEKKQLQGNLDLHLALSKQISDFLTQHFSYLLNFDKVIVYYDNGQVELTRLLAAVLTAKLSHVEFRQVFPADYKLFQSADLLCTLELIAHKAEVHTLSHSELQFFGNVSILRKNYLKPLRRKLLQ